MAQPRADAATTHIRTCCRWASRLGRQGAAGVHGASVHAANAGRLERGIEPTHGDSTRSRVVREVRSCRRFVGGCYRATPTLHGRCAALHDVALVRADDGGAGGGRTNIRPHATTHEHDLRPTTPAEGKQGARPVSIDATRRYGCAAAGVRLQIAVKHTDLLWCTVYVLKLMGGVQMDMCLRTPRVRKLLT
jgi:hypothetical protein